jgi:pimeloyl-ACP methyl ester carboxylesterase
MNASRLLITCCQVFILYFSACSHASNSPDNGPDVSTSAGKVRAVIFVHGIYGSGRDTWASENPKAYWPDLMRSDSQFAGADVIVADYATSLTGNSNSVTAIAASLAKNLAPVFSAHKEVIFLCHSLGGLIVKQLLLDNPQYAQKVPFIVFYGTPGAGSFVARFASVFSNDPLLQAMSDAGDNNYLLNLEGRWRGAQFKIHRYCAYEEVKVSPRDLRGVFVGGAPNADRQLHEFVGGIYVVDPFSATYGCDSNSSFTGIAANHMGIVKPTNIKAASYILFAKYYAANGILHQAPAEPIRYDKVLCAFYGEALQGSQAWNKDEVCPIPQKGLLDQDFHQGDFSCCGGGAGPGMTIADIPAGLEVRVDGGHFWAVEKRPFDNDNYRIHTYCGPEPAPGPGCNVKVKIIGHYKILPSEDAGMR